MKKENKYLCKQAIDIINGVTVAGRFRYSIELYLHKLTYNGKLTKTEQKAINGLSKALKRICKSGYNIKKRIEEEETK